MKSISWVPMAALLSAAVGACGTSPKAQLPSPPVQVAATSPPPAAPVHEAVVEDPVGDLIATSAAHFEAGQRELEQGHLVRAKTEFDLALDVLLQSPNGARTSPRLREHFDRLVDRINAIEMVALAQGDGFEEKPSEPASIDRILEMSSFIGSPPEPALENVVAEDLKTTAHDVPIPFNARVLQYVDLFQGRLRDFIAEGLNRGSHYLPMIQGVLRAEGLPLDLAYIPLIESAFKPNALSRARARGVWQFMQGTARENGLHQDWYIDERSDPEKSTRAAAQFLRTLHDMFEGDWHLALASYNGGPGRVQRAVKRSGMRDFWELSASTKYLPRETREYVPMILAAMIIAKNPAQYGFDVQPAPAVAFEKARVPGGLDLRRVAEWTGVDIGQIQQLNPELRRWTTPLREDGYDVKVPVGSASAVQAKLATVDPSELVALKFYRVKRGETLTSIARKLSVGRADLAEANSLRLRSRIRVGQELVIPRAPAPVMAKRVDRPAPPQTVMASRSLGAVTSAAPTGRPSDRMKLVYRVRKGDTLFAIARLFETTVDALKSWNRLRSSRLMPGDRLTVFTSRSH